MKLKSQWWIWRPRCTLNLGKIKFQKKGNLQSPWRMEDLTLPSVGASFKKWVWCTPIFPKAMAHFLNFPKKKLKKLEIVCIGSGVGPWLAGDRWSLAGLGPRPAIADPWLLDRRRPWVGGPMSANKQRSLADRGRVHEPQPVQIFFNSSCLPFFVHVVNSFSLVLAHACPAQSSTKNFKHP
jgi:hypothetical protein